MNEANIKDYLCSYVYIYASGLQCFQQFAKWLYQLPAYFLSILHVWGMIIVVTIVIFCSGIGWLIFFRSGRIRLENPCVDTIPPRAARKGRKTPIPPSGGFSLFGA